MEEIISIKTGNLGDGMRRTTKITTIDHDSDWIFGSAPYNHGGGQVFEGSSSLTRIGGKFGSGVELAELKGEAFPPTIFKTAAKWGATREHSMFCSRVTDKRFISMTRCGGS